MMIARRDIPAIAIDAHKRAGLISRDLSSLANLLLICP